MSCHFVDNPSSFDPALLYSDVDLLENSLNSTSHSDDLEALQACITEDSARKTREGVVIQYRAWNLVEIFRSEGEHSIGTASTLRRNHRY